MTGEPDSMRYRLSGVTIDGPRLPYGEPASFRIFGTVGDVSFPDEHDGAATVAFRINDWAGPRHDVVDERRARAAGDDTIVQVRVRSANLPALEEGVRLGMDALTQRPIELRLVRRDDGVYDLEVVTNPVAMMATPDPVDAEEVQP